MFKKGLCIPNVTLVHERWCYRVTLVSARFPVEVSSTTSFKTLYILAFGQDGAWQEATAGDQPHYPGQTLPTGPAGELHQPGLGWQAGDQ